MAYVGKKTDVFEGELSLSRRRLVDEVGGCRLSIDSFKLLWVRLTSCGSVVGYLVRPPLPETWWRVQSLKFYGLFLAALRPLIFLSLRCCAAWEICCTAWPVCSGAKLIRSAPKPLTTDMALSSGTHVQTDMCEDHYCQFSSTAMFFLVPALLWDTIDSSNARFVRHHHHRNVGFPGRWRRPDGYGAADRVADRYGGEPAASGPPAAARQRGEPVF